MKMSLNISNKQADSEDAEDSSSILVLQVSC